MTKKQALPQAAVSFIGMTTCIIMASELWEDVLNDTDNMRVPAIFKPFLFAALVILAALEGEKVRKDLRQAWR